MRECEQLASSAVDFGGTAAEFGINILNFLPSQNEEN